MEVWLQKRLLSLKILVILTSVTFQAVYPYGSQQTSSTNEYKSGELIVTNYSEVVEQGNNKII